MKHLLLLALLLVAPRSPAQYGLRRIPPPPTPGAVPPDLPLLDPDPAFPLRFHIVSDRWGGLGYRNHGYGSANLVDPAKDPTQLQGFNFAFQCDQPFRANENPAESYQARWKKAPYELEILTLDATTNHARTCRLHLAPALRPFDSANTVRYTHGVSSSLRVRWSDPDFASERSDPNYPLQFHVFEGQRRENDVNDEGWGTGNIVDPAQPASRQRVDYQYECTFGFLNNSQTMNYYQARWLKPGRQIEVLLERPGTDKVDRCAVTVSLHPAAAPAAPPTP